MRSYLLEHGVPENRILMENNATYTEENLRFSQQIIQEIKAEDLKVGVVTGAFHLPRTRLIARRIDGFPYDRYFFFAAYGPHTAPDNCYLNEQGKRVVLTELRKYQKLSFV